MPRPRHSIAQPAMLAAAMLVVLASPAAQAQSFDQITGVSGAAGAVRLDEVMTVQPIALCNQLGNVCTDAAGLINRDFLVQTYARVGVAVALLPTRVLRNDSLMTALDARTDAFSMATLQNLHSLGVNADATSTNFKTLNLYFADDLQAAPGATLFGFAAQGGNGAVINSTAVAAYNRGDTVAHELGHNLGANHGTLGAGGANNLMTDGTGRTVPASVLTAEQKTQILGSEFTVQAPRITMTHQLTGTESSLTFNFVSGPEDFHLQRLMMDLPNVSQAVPDLRVWGQSQRIELGATTLMPGDIASAFYCEDRPQSGGRGQPTVGPPGCGGLELNLEFGAGKFGVGDSITFTLALTHLQNDEIQFDLDRPIEGARVGLIYDTGMSTVGLAVAQDSLFDSHLVTGLMQSTAAPSPFGDQLPPGYVLPPSTIDLDPVLTPVPEPATVALMTAGLLGLGGLARRRNRAVAGSTK